MDTKSRSKLANELKKQYIKEGKKRNVLKKINKKVSESKLSKIREENNSGSETETQSEDDQYVLHFDDTQDTKIYRKKKPKKEETDDDIEKLQLQKQIEELKLKQLKKSQTSKTGRGHKKPVDIEKSEPIPIPIQAPKPINHKAQAIKNKLLVEF